MTMRKVFLPLSLLLASSLLAACGTGLPDAASRFSLAEVAQLYNTADSSQSWPGDQFQMLGQPQKQAGFGPGGKMGPPGFKPEPSAEQQAFQATLSAAFVSDSFDIEALSAQLPSPPERPAPDAEHLSARAEAMIARAQAGDLPPSPPEKPATEANNPHLSRLQKALNLSAEQISQLQALQPDRASHQAAHAERHAALVAELSKASPSVEAVVALLQPPDDSARPSPLQALADLHSILSPEQRQLAVDQDLLPLRPPGHGMHGAPGAHGGHGGQMGPKGPRPGPGFGGFGPGGKMGPPGFKPEPSAEQQAFQATLSAAFVSDSFDIEALSAQLPSPPERPAPDAEHLSARAEAMIARAQAGDLPPSPPEKPATEANNPHLSRLQKALNLSAEQISQLQALQPDRASHQAAHAERHAALVAELSKASPSVEAVVALLQPPDDSARPSPLQALADLHSILSPEQRQLAVDQDLLPLRPPGHGMHGAPGAHGGHGGQMGPKGPRPGPGFGGFGQPGGYSGY
ncbi:MAG: hypothetical protein IGS03_10375 [Candidatus Sericytochromatia bacterium]|nr:hypothetical protein [Candidatus Sericytochromatia bacterium]